MQNYNVIFADLTHTGVGINADVFPLGISLVAAYAIQEIGDRIDVEIHKFPEELNEAIGHRPPDVLCLSHYMWNSRLTYVFAEYVKRLEPTVVVIAGGPDFPLPEDEREEFLKARPAIDFYIKWDGEHAFVQLMNDLMDMDLDIRSYKERGTASSNVCYVTQDRYIEGPNHRVQNLMSIPSPYVMGLLDKFFEFPLMPMFETTRGCPYSCTFCNDGSELRNKVVSKTTEFVHDELNYIADKKPASAQLCFADLNFGMYKHDLETAKTIRDVRKRTQWPDRMQGSMGKSQPERLVEVARIINQGDLGILKLGSSLQSTDAEVLQAIKRKNLSMDDLLEMRKDRGSDGSVNLQDYTELIVPLPEQTKDKHLKSIRDVVDRLEMNNMDVHQLTMLRGSHMATPAERKKHGLVTRYRVLVGCLGIYDIGADRIPVTEFEEIVVATRTMSFEDYLECRVMTLLVKVYIDNDPFKEIFEILRHFGQSPFEVLERLQERYFTQRECLAQLLEKFIHGTKIKLFDNLEDLDDVTEKGDIEMLISGDYGQNELLTHRVQAIWEHYSEVSGALEDAVLSQLREKGILTDEISLYVREALQFCECRRFNPNEVDEAKESQFEFDFLAAEASGFRVDPKRIRRSVKLRFAYELEDANIIRKQRERWGTDTLHQIGKFMQKTNFLRTRRKVREIAL